MWEGGRGKAVQFPETGTCMNHNYKIFLRGSQGEPPKSQSLHNAILL